MAIVINGSGTVTGLAVGGLPDGTVDAGTLATDSVVTGKIADGTIANADIADLAASKLTGALPAISGASLTGIGGRLINRAILNSTTLLVNSTGVSLAEADLLVGTYTKQEAGSTLVIRADVPFAVYNIVGYASMNWSLTNSANTRKTDIHGQTIKKEWIRQDTSLNTYENPLHTVHDYWILAGLPAGSDTYKLRAYITWSNGLGSFYVGKNGWIAGTKIILQIEEWSN